MFDAVLLLLLFGASYLMFAFFALSQRRHWQAVAGKWPYSIKFAYWMRGSALALLLISSGIALFRDGPSYGAILWITIQTICALLVVLTLTFKPNHLRFLMGSFDQSF